MLFLPTTNAVYTKTSNKYFKILIALLKFSKKNKKEKKREKDRERIGCICRGMVRN